MLINVALPVPLYKTFDYKVSKVTDLKSQCSTTNNLPPIGSRVQVPFGRQVLIGIVIDYTAPENTTVPANKLKSIIQIIDQTPLVDKSWLQLAKWLSSYYHYPLGDVINVMLPTYIREGKDLPISLPFWRISPTVDTTPPLVPAEISSRAIKQIECYKKLYEYGKYGIAESEISSAGLTKAHLMKLAEKDIVERFLLTKPSPSPVLINNTELNLNDEQQTAVNAIIDSHKNNTYKGFLLNGITGSGKTEVYLQAMKPILEAGKQVLILVPEIGLTPQTQVRFAHRFTANILLLHSGINNTKRMQGWQACRDGQAQIIIGTRSSLLYPFANLGLIIVDESHDGSYKQQDTLRYHATDVALYRGYQSKIPVVLGTATPSIERLKLVEDNKLTNLQLTKRAGNAKPPTLYLVDGRKDSNDASTHLQKMDGTVENTGLTNSVIKAMRQSLEAGEQVLVFINRRGYAPILLCSACGWQADCPRCESHLTLHKSNLNSKQQSYLKCHHCNWQTAIPKYCPSCSSYNLDAVGIGTTRLTESLHAIFCNPQTSKNIYPIIQIDRDTTSKKGSWDNIYETIQSGDPAILVGTQMITKGHHFPNVTLVVLPNADRGFLSADFRSPEHTAQLIVQVAGRAGRGEKTGKVLIQTVQPDNPLLLSLVKDGYQKFAEKLMIDRKLLGLPPYSYAALVRCESKTQQQTINTLNEAKLQLPTNHQMMIVGPIEAPMKKKNNHYQSQLLILSKDRPQLHNTMSTWWVTILNLPSTKYVKITLDIDPIGW